MIFDLFAQFGQQCRLHIVITFSCIRKATFGIIYEHYKSFASSVSHALKVADSILNQNQKHRAVISSNYAYRVSRKGCHKISTLLKCCSKTAPTTRALLHLLTPAGLLQGRGEGRVRNGTAVKGICAVQIFIFHRQQQKISALIR